MEAGGTMWTMCEHLLLPHCQILHFGFVLPFVLLWDLTRSSCSRLKEVVCEGMQALLNCITGY